MAEYPEYMMAACQWCREGVPMRDGAVGCHYRVEQMEWVLRYPACTAPTPERHIEQLTARVAELEADGTKEREDFCAIVTQVRADLTREVSARKAADAESMRLRAALEEMGAVLKCWVIHHGYHAMSCLEKSDWIVAGKDNCTKEYVARYASGESLCTICKIAKIRRAVLSSEAVAVEVERQQAQDDPIRKALEEMEAEFRATPVTIQRVPRKVKLLAAAWEAMQGAKP